MTFHYAYNYFLVEVCRLGIKLKDLSVEAGHISQQISKKNVNYLEFFLSIFHWGKFLRPAVSAGESGHQLPSLLLPAASEETGTYWQQLLFCKNLGLKKVNICISSLYLYSNRMFNRTPLGSRESHILLGGGGGRRYRPPVIFQTTRPASKIQMPFDSTVHEIWKMWNFDLDIIDDIQGCARLIFSGWLDSDSYDNPGDSTPTQLKSQIC